MSTRFSLSKCSLIIILSLSSLTAQQVTYKKAGVDVDAGNRLIEIIAPTVAGMAQEKTPYCGFLYAGLMVGHDGSPKVLEFNCRLGDPEAQPLLMRLQSDLVALCDAALAGTLDAMTVTWDSRVALGIVLASGNYPYSYVKNVPISGLLREVPLNAKVFHAATALCVDQIVTTGGRVLCVTVLEDTIHKAQKKGYEIIRTLSFPQMFYRTDIGSRAIAWEQTYGS